MLPALNADGLLPAGKHAATIKEIRERFVDEAPFPAERGAILDSFVLWANALRLIVPARRFWIDGGFVTHKSWAAPGDLDVVFFVKADDLNALDDGAQRRLLALLTDPTDGARVQPMGGLIDAFYAVRGDQQGIMYWQHLWSRVTGLDKTVIDGAEKGFVEVIF